MAFSEDKMDSDQVLDEYKGIEGNIVCAEEQELPTDIGEPSREWYLSRKIWCITLIMLDTEFGVRVKVTKYIKGSKYVIYGCNRGGQVHRTCFDPTKGQLTTKTNCPASIFASSHADKQWVLNKVVLERNHNLDVDKALFLKWHRYIPVNTQMAFELNHAAGIKTSKIVTAYIISAGGFEKLTWIERDARNHLARVRRTELKQGDAQAMLAYFRKMHADNPGFFHMYEVDDQNRLRSIFWADARSIAACKEFGDVITFDTTYLVNSYNMPFAPFIGVNHHGQSTLLGCGLITNEDIESFEWVFN